RWSSGSCDESYSEELLEDDLLNLFKFRNLVYT
ncbi:hypothetical protein Tco_1488021, partial [Tanacetum coccineum]